MMSYLKSIETVSEMCRICLGKSKNLVSMEETLKGITLLETLETAFNVQISTDPQLPSNICVSCIRCINFADDLKEIYLISQNILKKYADVSKAINSIRPFTSQFKEKLNLPIPDSEELIDEPSSSMSANEKEIASIKIIQIQPTKQKFRCKYCHKCFNSKDSVKKHFKICNSKSSQCDYCPKEFSSRILKMSHIKNAHKRKEKKVYKCDICNETFKTPNSKTYHNLTRHNDNPTEYICEICGKKFVIKNSLRLHMFKHNKDEAKVICPICGKSFHYTGGLYYHMKVHKNERNYKCSFCPRVFLNMTAVKRHTRTHTGERPYKCHMCPKDFCSTGELKTHIMRHTGQKPHSCKYCHKPYVSRYNLHIHMSSHIGHVPCKYCHKSYLNEEVLELHIKFKHKDKYKKPLTLEELVDEDGLEENEYNENDEEIEFIQQVENGEEYFQQVDNGKEYIQQIVNGEEYIQQVDNGEEYIQEDDSGERINFIQHVGNDGVIKYIQQIEDSEGVKYIQQVQNGEEIMFGMENDSYLVYENAV